jgi:hypothetical protein
MCRLHSSTTAIALFFVLIVISFQALGQLMASEEVDTTKIGKWVPKFEMEYQGTYHFGDSEDESDLVLIFTVGNIIGQIRSGSWSSDGNQWIWKFENLRDIKIEGNKFSSYPYSGEFVRYDDNNELHRGLKINNPWSSSPEKGQWEVGLKRRAAIDYFRGKFTQASLRILDIDELKKMTKSDLSLMRNEIFARYGFKFKAGGTADKYFRSQSWYVAQYENVDMFLTDIERQNIETIRKIEKP